LNRVFFCIINHDLRSIAKLHFKRSRISLIQILPFLSMARRYQSGHCRSKLFRSSKCILRTVLHTFHAQNTLCSIFTFS
jgi:hypothetical protein